MNELDTHKQQLRQRYLNIIFKRFDKRRIDIFKELKRIVNFNGDIDEVIAYADYKPSFAEKKNKFQKYALFTESTFYGVDVYGKPVTCELNDIEMVFTKNALALFSKGIGDIICYSGKKFSLNSVISNVFFGFTVINNINSTDDTAFDKFLIDRTTKIFGEITEWQLSDSQRWSIETTYRHQAEHNILYRIKLVDITLSAAYFQITIKDTDINDDSNSNALFSEWEWERAVNRYNTDFKIKEIFQKSILNTIGLHYRLEDIHFFVKSKIALSTRINNLVDMSYYTVDRIRETNYRNIENINRKYNKK